jgi:hypothetical protein
MLGTKICNESFGRSLHEEPITLCASAAVEEQQNVIRRGRWAEVRDDLLCAVFSRTSKSDASRFVTELPPLAAVTHASTFTTRTSTFIE